MLTTSIDRELARGTESVLAKLYRGRYGLIREAVAELEGWASFQPGRKRRLRLSDLALALLMDKLRLLRHSRASGNPVGLQFC